MIIATCWSAAALAVASKPPQFSIFAIGKMIGPKHFRCINLTEYGTFSYLANTKPIDLGFCNDAKSRFKLSKQGVLTFQGRPLSRRVMPINGSIAVLSVDAKGSADRFEIVRKKYLKLKSKTECLFDASDIGMISFRKCQPGDQGLTLYKLFA